MSQQGTEGARWPPRHTLNVLTIVGAVVVAVAISWASCAINRHRDDTNLQIAQEQTRRDGVAQLGETTRELMRLDVEMQQFEVDKALELLATLDTPPSDTYPAPSFSYPGDPYGYPPSTTVPQWSQNTTIDCPWSVDLSIVTTTLTSRECSPATDSMTPTVVTYTTRFGVTPTEATGLVTHFTNYGVFADADHGIITFSVPSGEDICNLDHDLDAYLAWGRNMSSPGGRSGCSAGSYSMK